MSGWLSYYLPSFGLCKHCQELSCNGIPQVDRVMSPIEGSPIDSPIGHTLKAFSGSSVFVRWKVVAACVEALYAAPKLWWARPLLAKSF